AGFTYRQGKGSHTVWEHPLLPEKITLSGNDGDDAPNYHEKRVMSDLQKLKEIEE
ncbi:type II toxin-antitoxin system HicA family toxin, partial [Microcoleus sp. K4-C2]